MADNPRRHHFLPIFYLRNFCSAKGQLYVYERGKLPRTSVPKQEAHIRDLYTFEDEGGKKFEIEKALSKYEGDAAPVIQGILDRTENRSHRHLTDSETDILRYLVALMFVRVPAGRKLDEQYIEPAVRKLLEGAAHDSRQFAELLKDVPEDENLSVEERALLIEDVRLGILNGYYNEPPAPGFRLQAMLHVAGMIAIELQGYSCLIVLAPKHEPFITGDTPVCTATEIDGKTQLGTAFADKNTAIWLPISTKVCLLWRRREEPGFGKLPSRGVRIVKRTTMRFAERFVYSNEYSLKLAETFTRTPQMVLPGKNAFIPMWDGKPILDPE
jgi:hypothetical protein